MKTIPQILDALGPQVELAKELEVTQQNISGMRLRESIPPRFWRRIVRLASERKVEGVTLEALATLAAKEKNRVAA